MVLTIVDDEWGAIGERDLDELRATAEGVAVRECSSPASGRARSRSTAAIAVGAPMLVLASEASAFESVVIGTHKVGTFHGHALGISWPAARRRLAGAHGGRPGRRLAWAQWRRGRGGGGAGLDGRGEVRHAEAVRLEERLLLIRADGPTAIEEQALLRIVWDLPEATDLADDVVVRRSTTPPGETLAGVSRRAVLTVTRAADGSRCARIPSARGRTNGDLLMNAGGPVVVVPFESAAERPAAAPSLVHGSTAG